MWQFNDVLKFLNFSLTQKPGTLDYRKKSKYSQQTDIKRLNYIEAVKETHTFT